MTCRADLDRALEQAEQLWVANLSGLSDAVLSASSGCDQWTIRDLVNHVAGGGHRYAMLLRGQSAADTAATRGNDYLGTDSVAEFWRYEQMMRAAADTADVGRLVDHRAGPRSAMALLQMRVMELTLHTYDLCVGCRTAWDPPDDLVSYVLTEIAPIIDELRALGMFGAATPARSTSPGERLLAFTGR